MSNRLALKPSYVTSLASSLTIAFALIKFTPLKFAPAWKPALDEATGRPFCLTVPAVLNLAEADAFNVPAT